MNRPESQLRVPLARRDAIKWILTAAVSTRWLAHGSFATDTTKPTAGYGTDPNLAKEYGPGDLWPLTFDATQRRAAATLCDVIIPAEPDCLSASALHVHEFIDEWISAPYPGHTGDRRTILDGLAWLDVESRERYGMGFAELAHQQRTAICDDICHLPSPQPDHQQAAQFFKKFRDLTTSGYYTTPQGMKELGYVGNTPLATFAGPPPEVLRHLGLA